MPAPNPTQYLAWSLHRTRRQTLAEVDGLRPDHFVQQVTPGEHHPTWIIGHLLLADSYLLHLIQVEALPPDFKDLLQAHGPGSSPQPDAGIYLPPAQLLERLEHTGSRRHEAVLRMTADDLQAPTPDPNLAAGQPTIGHHLHTQVFHEGHHCGQLAAWRRHHGFPPASWAFAQP